MEKLSKRTATEMTLPYLLLPASSVSILCIFRIILISILKCFLLLFICILFFLLFVTCISASCLYLRVLTTWNSEWHVGLPAPLLQLQIWPPNPSRFSSRLQIQTRSPPDHQLLQSWPRPNPRPLLPPQLRGKARWSRPRLELPTLHPLTPQTPLCLHGKRPIIQNIGSSWALLLFIYLNWQPHHDYLSVPVSFDLFLFYVCLMVININCTWTSTYIFRKNMDTPECEYGSFRMIELAERDLAAHL